MSLPFAMPTYRPGVSEVPLTVAFQAGGAFSSGSSASSHSATLDLGTYFAGRRSVIFLGTSGASVTGVTINGNPVIGVGRASGTDVGGYYVVVVQLPGTTATVAVTLSGSSPLGFVTYQVGGSVKSDTPFNAHTTTASSSNSTRTIPMVIPKDGVSIHITILNNTSGTWSNATAGSHTQFSNWRMSSSYRTASQHTADTSVNVTCSNSRTGGGIALR